MILAALALSVLAFIAVLRLSGTVTVAGNAAAVARDAAAAMRSPGLTDEEKEARSRRAAVALFGAFLRIAAGSLAAIAASAAVVWAGAAAGFYRIEEAIAVATGWPFLVGASVAAVAAWIAADRLTRQKAERP